jgi:hypothetical protein
MLAAHFKIMKRLRTLPWALGSLSFGTIRSADFDILDGDLCVRNVGAGQAKTALASSGSVVGESLPEAQCGTKLELRNLQESNS